jgi:mannose-6-phosphate isomerase-like protein (cupin superfamily)
MKRRIGVVLFLSMMLYVADLFALEQESGAVALEAWLKENPIAADKELAIGDLWRSESSSTHVVQIRTEEKMHTHQNHDLVAILQKGSGTLYIGSSALAMAPGSVASVPRGVPHAFVNDSTEPAAAFVVFTPPFDGKDTVPVEQ